MDARMIFFDPSGRRRKRFRLGLILFSLLTFVSVIALAATIELAPAEPILPVATETARPLHPPTTAAQRGGKALQREVRRMLGFTARERGPSAPLRVGFTVPWDPESALSLRRHIDDLDWVAPVWLTVTGPQHRLNQLSDPETRQVINLARHRPLVLPVLQNASNGLWDQSIGPLLASKSGRQTLISRIEAYLLANRANGLVFDLEQLRPQDEAGYRALLAEAQPVFRSHKWVSAVTAPATAAPQDLRALAARTDKLFVMNYDEHEEASGPGPIASKAWWLGQAAAAARAIPRDKLILTLANYAYDWHSGTADPLTVEEAWQAAGDSDTKPVFDPASGNSVFAFADQDGQHTVWIADAASASDEVTLARRLGINQLGFWRMGAEDPALWNIFGRNANGSIAGTELLSAGSNVDIEGPGEILRIAERPTEGRRSIGLGRDGLVKSVDFQSLPQPYVIERTGYRPKEVALTFDDGPDARWTPQILDILKSRNVPATFFIVGENALTNQPLLARMIAQGDEVGSHTYTHPNLATTPRAQTLFELNANQRLFQAYTGRSMKLFRPPYFGDAEPSTADELGPVLAAQQRGYVTVGLHVDGEDWRRPGAGAIVRNVLGGVAASNPERSGNVVLLHDSGGDRSQTIAALPAIIDTLKANGYRFVTVSSLAGIPPGEAMPKLSPGDARMANIDFALFELLGGFEHLLRFLFAAAITLGILRALALSALALREARREIGEAEPDIDPERSLTVIIPAFNEEQVIERSVRQVLASTDVRLRLIVVDDGSTDRTSAIVRDRFAADPRVTLLTLANGGKANALNRALDQVTSDIVIALDADTQFEPSTIARLARWFVDPDLGAVAGNAKVGNRVNLVTKWQALEYVTAQNLERRALAQLGAITVVPGAVGAWRLAAIRAAGGYPPDTLAEDQDLTIAIQRLGWTVAYDQRAVAWTEAPSTLRGLAKQRFRWAFGTLQCLWKHRRVMADGKPRGLAFAGMPQAILFQLLFAAISPVIDLALVINLAQTWFSIRAHGFEDVQGDLQHMLLFWSIFAAIDLLAAGIAFALERSEQWSLLGWLLPQRFVYRQVMYYVVLKALVQALRGPRVGWTTIARKGTVEFRPAG